MNEGNELVLLFAFNFANNLRKKKVITEKEYKDILIASALDSNRL